MKTLVGTIFALSFYLTNTGRHTQFMRHPAALLKLANMPCPHALSLFCQSKYVMWFLCSPITLLKPRCTHHPALPSCLAKASGHVQTTKGTLLDYLLLWLGALHSEVPQSYSNHRDSSWQATMSRALYTQQTETHPHLPTKKAYIFVLELHLEETGSRFTTHLEVSEVPSGNRDWESPSLCSSGLATAHQYDRRLHTYLEPWSFASITWEIPPDLLEWMPTGFTIVVPCNCLYWHPYKTVT